MAFSEEDLAYMRAQGLSMPEPEEEEEGVTARRLNRSLLQGATFGFGDEIQSAVAASVAKLAGGKATKDMAWSDLYKQARDEERAAQEKFREESPVAAYGSEIAGGIGTGVVGGVKAAGTKLGQKLAQRVPTAAMAPTLGAGEGALYGAGQAQELGDVPQGAGIGAGAGAAGGAVMSILGKYVGRGAKAIWDRVSRSTVGQGNRVVREALEEAGLDAQQVRTAMQELGEDAVLADIDPTMAATLAGAHSVPGSGRSKVAKMLQERDAKQQTQLWNLAQEIAGNEGNVHQSSKALAQAQRQMAKPLYEEAYERSVEFTPALGELLDKPFVRAAYRKGQQLARNDVDRAVDTPPGVGRKAITEKTAERIAKGEEAPLTTEEWDWIQRGLRTKGDMAARAGAKDPARVYRGLRHELLEEVDEGNGTFAQARKVYAGFESLKESMTFGGKALEKKVDLDELREIVNDYGPADKQAFMIGVSKYIKDKIADYSARRDISQIPLFNNTLIKEKLGVVLGEEGAERLLAEAQKAHAFKRTSNAVLAGSQTANKQAVQAQLAGGDMAGGIADIATGLPVATAARSMMRGKGNQVPPEVAQSVSSTLTSTAPDLSVLAPMGPLGQSSLATNPLMQAAIQGGAPVAAGGPLASRRDY